MLIACFLAVPVDVFRSCIYPYAGDLRPLGEFENLAFYLDMLWLAAILLLNFGFFLLAVSSSIYLSTIDFYLDPFGYVICL